MKRVVVILVLCSCFFLNLNMINAQESKVFNQDWLDSDKIVFLDLMKTVLSDKKKVSFYLKELKGIDVRTSQDLEFGGQRTILALSGGYIFTEITICSFNDSVFYINASFYEDDIKILEHLAENNTEINLLLKKYWLNQKVKERFSNKYYNVLNYQYLNEDVFNRYKFSVSTNLGEIKDIPLSQEKNEAYKKLIQPYHSLLFGEFCGYSSSMTEGYEAIQILEKESIDVFLNIMRGYNPEGRVLALKKLLEKAIEEKINLTDEIKRLIVRVINLDSEIRCCVSCERWKEKTKEIFKREELIPLLTLNDIKL